MSKLQLRIFDGTRRLFAKPAQFLVTITDGNKVQRVRDYFTANDITFELPFFDNLCDNYTVLVWTKGFKQAGYFPVALSDAFSKTVDIMLVADDPGVNFGSAAWNAVKVRYPFLAGDVDDAAGAARYGNFMDRAEMPLACMLNICEAMDEIPLAQGTPLDYIKQICWDAPYAPAQDRFFAWSDLKLMDQIQSARGFAEELNPGLLHPGATKSWKQTEFGEANVQFTFHGGETKTVGGVDCVMVELDIDYYQDFGAHILLEVLVNQLTHSLTDPREVYVLRWIAGQTAGIPEFDPMYVLTA
ncbi:MAG TPA: hypothetical protein VGN16_18430 [Acidobacteriaceae bacterium]|jgi:hypothetical protein